jgi:O-antigen/teichoic acid export membrane protein
MRGPLQDELATWAAGTRQVGYERRNWPAVRRLAAICVILLLVGLAAHLLGLSIALVAVCGAGAAVAGVAMLIWFVDRRRFRNRPPDGS